MVQQLEIWIIFRQCGRGRIFSPVTAEEWTGLLEKIEDLGEYEYVILDLSESMQGLFDILRKCKKVFTSVGKDRMAERKLMQDTSSFWHFPSMRMYWKRRKSWI